MCTGIEPVVAASLISGGSALASSGINAYGASEQPKPQGQQPQGGLDTSAMNNLQMLQTLGGLDSNRWKTSGGFRLGKNPFAGY